MKAMSKVRICRPRPRPSLRPALIALAASLVCGLSNLAPQASAAVAEPYTFAFQNADVSQVVQEVMGQLETPYVLDPGVAGKMSFRIEQRLTREQLLAAFEATLQANGFSMVRNGGLVTITPQAKAKSAAGIRRGVEGVGQAGYEVVAVPLAYAQPVEVGKALEAISGAGSVLYANDKLGVLLLGGSGGSLKSALEAVKVFDQSAFEASKIRYFELGQAQASTVAGELDRIVQGAGLVGVSVVPLKRLNGLIVFGRSAESLEEIRKWVLRLDTPGKDVASTLWVYRPSHGSAEALARTLNTVLGSGPARLDQTATTATPASGAGSSAIVASGPGATAFGAGEEEVRVGVDRESNTLLFFASQARWIQIQKILAEIDRQPRQVLIEASILEVTLGKEFRFGVDWKVLADELQIAAINNAQGLVRPSFPGVSVTYLNSDVEAAIRALGSRTGVEVVSAPKIIALDNRTARLQVGDQVPVIVQTSQNTSTAQGALVSTVEYRSTGVILTVTPRISGGDQLILDVSQEVSAVARTITSGIDSPTIQQRRFESTLLLQDGGVVALGGLISTNRATSDAGVPGLKDIPGLGALFRTEGRNQTRSELIVLLRAKIIADRAGADRVMADLLADMKELQNRGLVANAP